MAFYSLFISFFYCYVATTRRCRGTFLFILWPATINKRRHCGTNDVAHPGTFPMEKRTHSLGMWWEVSATFRIFDWFGTNFNICVWARARTLSVLMDLLLCESVIIAMTCSCWGNQMRLSLDAAFCFTFSQNSVVQPFWPAGDLLIAHMLSVETIHTTICRLALTIGYNFRIPLP